MQKYTSASYQQDLIESLKKNCEIVFWGPGHPGFDISLNFDQIKKKLIISDNDILVVGHSWLSDIPLNKNINYDNYYTWIDNKIINKNSLEYCGNINFANHPGTKIFLLNKEYISLEKKLNFAKINNFNYVLTSNINFKNYEKLINLKFIFFPYAISNDFIYKNDELKKYDLFFSGLIQNQYFFNLNRAKSKRTIIQKKLFFSPFDIPFIRKNTFKGNIYWNIYTGVKVKDIIIKTMGKYKRMPREEYIKKLHQSKIILNTLSPDNLIGPRFYETMASKAICLSEESSVVNKIFKPLKHYVPLNSSDEFLEKVKFCLSDSIEIEDIRENAFNYVVENHTYDKRAEQILSLV